MTDGAPQARFVRPYVLTRGRVQPTRALRPSSTVVATGTPPAAPASPEASLLVEQCVAPRTVAWLAAGLDVPAGVVRFLVSELVEQGALEVQVDVTAGRDDATADGTTAFEDALALLRSL